MAPSKVKKMIVNKRKKKVKKSNDSISQEMSALS